LQLCADILRSFPDNVSMIKSKWKALGDLALESADFDLASVCFENSQDVTSLLLLYSSCGDATKLRKVAESAEAKNSNIAFLSYFLLQDTHSCLKVLLDSKRFPEAGFFARAYCPSEVSRVIKMWKADLGSVNQAVAKALADPEEYPDLFPGFGDSKKLQEILEKTRKKGLPKAKDYESVKEMLDRQVHEELTTMGEAEFEKAWGIANFGPFTAANGAGEQSFKPPPRNGVNGVEKSVTEVSNGVEGLHLKEDSNSPAVDA